MRRNFGRRSDGLLPHQLAEVDEVSASTSSLRTTMPCCCGCCVLLRASGLALAYVCNILNGAQVIFGRDTDGSSTEPPPGCAGEKDAPSKAGGNFSRRRTEITYQPCSAAAQLSTAAEANVWDNRASTDLHMDNRMDRAFRAQEAAQKMEHRMMPNGLPKYGRRRFPMSMLSRNQTQALRMLHTLAEGKYTACFDVLVPVVCTCWQRCCLLTMTYSRAET